MREADQDNVASVHDFSGASSYSSQPLCSPVSQASAWSSSRVQGLSSYSCSFRRSYSSTRSKTNVSFVRGFTTRGGVASGFSNACICCSVSSIMAASFPESYHVRPPVDQELGHDPSAAKVPEGPG